MQQEPIRRSAERLAKNRDLTILIDARCEEIADLVLTESLDDMEKVKGLLLQYHALREFHEFVQNTAEEEKIGRIING